MLVAAAVFVGGGARHRPPGPHPAVRWARSRRSPTSATTCSRRRPTCSRWRPRLTLVERGAHPDRPDRRYEGTLRYEAPERLWLHLEETSIGAGGLARQRHRARDRRADGVEHRAPRLPGRPADRPASGAPEARLVTGTAPFARRPRRPPRPGDPGRRLPAERGRVHQRGRRRHRRRDDRRPARAGHRRAASRGRAAGRAPDRRGPPGARPRDVHDPAPHRDRRRRTVPDHLGRHQRLHGGARHRDPRPPRRGDGPARRAVPRPAGRRRSRRRLRGPRRRRRPHPRLPPAGLLAAPRWRAHDDRRRPGGPLVEQRAGVDPARRHDRSDRRRPPRRHRTHRPPDPGRRRRRLHGPGRADRVAPHGRRSISPSPARSRSRTLVRVAASLPFRGETLPDSWPQGDGLDDAARRARRGPTVRSSRATRARTSSWPCPARAQTSAILRQRPGNRLDPPVTRRGRGRRSAASRAATTRSTGTLSWVEDGWVRSLRSSGPRPRPRSKRWPNRLEPG